VSEYQYYDFRAIDRPLMKKEIAALGSISTRAAITTTSFTNHYEWGDLKANPSKLLEKHFERGRNRTFNLLIKTKYRLLDQSMCSQRIRNTSFWLRISESRLIIKTSRRGCLEKDKHRNG
jgi:hypothetical protein